MQSQAPGKERRRFARITFNGTVTMTDAQGKKHEGSLLDISFKGALLSFKTPWNAKRGESYRLELKLGDGDVTINMDGEIAHIKEDHIGFACRNIDLESVTHLRRLVELNLGSDELLSRELSALVVNSEA